MGKQPKLTIGMAVYDDFNGVYFTLQSLRLHHDLSEVEIIVVDNAPAAPASAAIHQLIQQIAANGDTAGIRHVAAPEVIGTAAPRNRVFYEASAPWVMCIDSHVLPEAGSIARLIARIDGDDSADMLSGPIMYDKMDRSFIATHFIDFWRSEMWGIWGQAWEAPCADGDRFSVIELPNKRAGYLSLEMDAVPLLSSGRCDVRYPEVDFGGHETHLRAGGYKQLGVDPDDEFEIPGQGLGLFACRKATWQAIGGFNPLFRGFGGEELYIHEKIRRAGGRVLCLGFLKWVHRFAAPGSVKYRLTRWDKMRNYVLGHLELGRDLGPVHTHFVASGLVPQIEWDALVADPKSPLPPAAVIRSTEVEQTPEQIFEIVKAVPRDLNEHMDTLRALAAGCERVTEFSNRRESLIALAAGNPSILVSHNTEGDDAMVKLLLRLQPATASDRGLSKDIPTIDETDLLFIDSEHTEATLTDELQKYAPRTKRYIAIHDTVLHADRGEDGGPGIADAILSFLLYNKEWTVVAHYPHQYGLTVLGRQDRDRPRDADGGLVKIAPWKFRKGPGTELKKLLAMLGIRPSDSCDCNTKARRMNEWGIGGCREHFDEIVGWMRTGAPRWGWADKLKAAAGAVATGIAFKVDWLDPFPGLIEEAIRLAEGSENEE